VYNDAGSGQLRPVIITGARVARDKKYRKGWLDYYDLKTFLKDIPRTDKSGRKKQPETRPEESSDEEL